MLFFFQGVCFFCSNTFSNFFINNKIQQKMSADHSARRPKAQTSADHVEIKTAKDLGQPVQRITPESSNQVRSGTEGVTQKIQRAANNVKQAIMGSNNQHQESNKTGENQNSGLKKVGDEIKNLVKQVKEGDINWQQSFKNATSDIKKSLKEKHTQFSANIQKIYQGMLKNCLKQNQDQPHKLHKCWQEFSTKMQPVYTKMQQKSTESAETLKKCFQSKRNAKECVDEGIKFGQQSLLDATNSIKAYLV